MGVSQDRLPASERALPDGALLRRRANREGKTNSDSSAFPNAYALPAFFSGGQAVREGMKRMDSGACALPNSLPGGHGRAEPREGKG